MKRLIWFVLFSMIVCPAFLMVAEAMATGHVDSYIYPHVLAPGDKLTDGPNGKQIKIDDITLLIWVDQLPLAKFAHPTAYVLISGNQTRVVKGQWWPVLNEKRILYGERNLYAVLFDFELPSLVHQKKTRAYIYPHVLMPEDVLEDGPLEGDPIAIKDKTLLLWIDPHPDMRFTHPTFYVLISAKGVEVMDGGWWPVLNGKQILYGSQNKVAVISPFVILD